MNRSAFFVLLLLAAFGVPAGAQENLFPPLVAQKCTGCHPVPRPGCMPRHAWAKTIVTMSKLMHQAKVPFTETERRLVTDFYLKSAPEELEVIPDDYQEPLLSFTKTPVGLPSREQRPQVSSLRFCDLDGDGIENDIAVTDNANQSVSWLKFHNGVWTETVLAEINAPVSTRPVDFDQDGDIDLAVSAMGYMHPNDDLIGEFHLLLNQGNGKFEQQKIIVGSPRITDCAPGDFDGDGDIDFILCMFGWRTTGGIELLEQIEPGKFARHGILKANGCMRIHRNDINNDGLSDFIVLLTQQHESIVQFVNKGDKTFSQSIITNANHPAFGSSNIHLADLDQDGDEDILYTNGDMMDENPEPKPYHGVRWLENTGNGKYHIHYLAGMPGCYCAIPADMDGDGDLDVVISSMYFQWKERDFPSLAWLENIGNFREFNRRKIAYDPANMANIIVGDANLDGKLDIIGGGMHVPGPLERLGRITAFLGE